MWGPAARIGAHLDDGLIVPEGRLGWSLAVAGAALGAYFIRDSTSVSMAIGAVLQVAGGLLIIDSIRVFRRGEHPVTHGPFRWVRHPYYLGVLVLLLGAIVGLRAWAALILYLVAIRLTVKRARNEEHNLRLEFGPAYDTYAARVPFLLPLAPPLPPGGMPAVEAASRGLLGALLADGPGNESRTDGGARPGDPP
jgi:hypothetical protein